MWGIALVSLLLRISFVFGQNITDSTQAENKTLSMSSQKTDLNDLTEELTDAIFGSFLTDRTSAREFIVERSTPVLQPADEGRKLKHKKAELKFFMKTLLILKVVFSIILPLGIFISKFLSWKAVTLSLMAFMLAKISFVKNLLTTKNMFSATPTNFVPPVFIHGGPSDVLWKRQGEGQTIYPWNST